MLLLTIRSFTKTILSNSFFGKLTQSICKSCPADKCFQGYPLPELCDHIGELFLKLCAEYHNNVCLDRKALLSNLYDTWLAYMHCSLSCQLFLRKSVLLQSWETIWAVSKWWKPVAKSISVPSLCSVLFLLNCSSLFSHENHTSTTQNIRLKNHLHHPKKQKQLFRWEAK